MCPYRLIGISLDKYYSDAGGRVWDVGVTIRHQH